MKYPLFAALSLFSVFAAAAEPASLDRVTVNPAQPATVEYNYSQHLDIAKVVSIKADDPDTCGTTNANMVYVDSKGVTHSLEYTRMGNGCQNG
ncbi:DUF2790 domain-containing protein [Pseudomonas baltica]|jgi:hypothetical protein|uniref:DUF2790 domain-containing protein n=1 Tax=Pseudomonas baltica TaxID=2762576 RepID=UPI00289E891D|nr:DUF2790 domain-containing protein [Pseudomonas baltica]